MHVIDPKRYPLAPGAVYVPSTNSVWDAVSFENTVGMKNIVAVQPSIYGNDNSAMLDSMLRVGGIVADTTDTFANSRSSTGFSRL